MAEARRVLGPAGYGAQHQQNPVVSGGANFKEADLRWYVRRGDYIVLHAAGGERPFLPAQARRFLTVDPAASASTRADYTVVSAWCISPWGDLVWLGCDRFRAEIPDIVPRIAAAVLKWKPGFVGIEAVAANSGVYQLACRHTAPVIPAAPMDPAGRDKLPHATAAITLVSAGRVYLPTAQADPTFPREAVVEELIRFTGDPKADENDDIVDTLSYSAEYATGVPVASTKGSAPRVIGGGR